jgi:hypothetical protein
MKRRFLLLLIVALPYLGNSQCPAPTNLQAIMGVNTVTMNWDAVNGASEYLVQFKYPQYGWDNIEYQETVNSNTLTLNDVLLSVSVDWRVLAVCNGTQSTPANGPATLNFPCPEPTGLSASNISGTSATFTWVHHPGAIPDYQAAILAYRPAGTNASWIPLGQSNTASYTLTGLLPGTTYEWCVNQICAYFHSDPAISTFTTLAAPCGTPSLYTSNNITASQANVVWYAVPGAVSYSVEYKTSTATVWTVAQASTTLLNTTLTGLAASTTYQWRIKADCGANNLGSYSAIGTFTTGAAPVQGCGVPANVVISNIGNRSATASWAAVPGATGYQFQYKLSTSNTWIGNNVSTNTHTRTTYVANSSYQYRVRALCGTVYGAFSPEGSFSTLNCVSAGSNSYEYIDQFSLGTITRVSTAEPNGYVNTGQSTNISLGSNNNTFTLSAGTNGTFRNQHYGIFIDYNRNGSYADNGEKVAWGQLTNSGVFTGNINIANSATAGATGLRVVLAKAGSPNITGCYENFEGETEDYSINLTSVGSRLSAELASNAEDLKPEVLAMPNPNNGIFEIKMKGIDQPHKMQLINSMGRVIKSQLLQTSAPLHINIQSEPSGLYFIQIQDKTGKSYHQKLLKNY